MKKLLFKGSSVLLIAISLFLFSCEDVKELVTVEVPVNPPAISLDLVNPPNPLGQQQIPADEIVLAEKTFEMGLIEVLKEKGADIKNLKKLLLKSATLQEIEVDEDYNLDELKTLKLYFDGKVVAEVLKVDKEKNEITLKINKKDILSYAKQKSILVQVTSKQRISVPEIRTKLDLDFLAKVGMK